MNRILIKALSISAVLQAFNFILAQVLHHITRLNIFFDLGIAIEVGIKMLPKISLTRNQIVKGRDDTWLISGRNVFNVVVSIGPFLKLLPRYTPQDWKLYLSAARMSQEDVCNRSSQ